MSSANEPDAYKQGWINFFGLKFAVTPAVLIPRPESEMLIAEVKKHASPDSRILEIGTGSGCLAVTLAQTFPHVYATDISPEALEIASQNAHYHGVKVNFLRSDLLENVNFDFDILLANLPYIPTARIPTLDPSVKDFEPHLALDGGRDGFDLYRRLFSQVKNSPLMVIEIDDTQGEIVRKEAANYFSTSQVEIKKDFSHLDRLALISPAPLT